MAEAELKVEIREKTGHQTAKALRMAEKIPAIFYGLQQEPVSIIVDARNMEKLLNTEVNILDVVFPDGKSKKSIIRDVQRDPVSDLILHVDIMGINMKEKINISIPVIFSGIPIGVKDDGGILEHLIREVEVEGLPLDIPDHIEVDVSDLHVGNTILVSQLSVENVKILLDENQAVANVVHAKVAKTVAEEEIEGEEEVEVEGEEEETESE